MQKYIGTKIIEAEPANRYELHSGGHITKKCSEEWTKDEAEILKQPFNVKAGYAVRYADGYESWSPKDVFEEAYREASGVSFGLALEAMKKGKGARLPKWSKDVIIRAQFPDEHSKMTAPYLYVESRFGRVPWKETMIELFSDDWEIVEV